LQYAAAFVMAALQFSQQEGPMSVHDPHACATVEASTTPAAPALSERGYELTLHLGGQSRKLDYCAAFVFAHDLLRRLKCASAAAVFERLCQVSSDEPRAHVLLAVSEARMGQYSAAFKALNDAAFGDALLAADIYDAIVESRMGFKEDAIQKLLRLAGAYEKLPTLCLWLGDMYEAARQTNESVKWWQSAIARDRPQGAVCLAARRQINRITKTNSQVADGTTN
jgi:tetratricopeptide (TPR) repeat protein